MIRRYPDSVIVAAALAAFLYAVPVSAQDPYDGGPVVAPLAGEGQNAYGTTATSHFTIVGYSFNPRSGDSTLYTSGSFLYSRTGGSAFLIAEVQVPSGALITGTEIEGCDTDAAADITTWLIQCPTPAGVCVLHQGGTTAGAPGCALTLGALATPQTVNNATNTYFVQLGLGSTTTATSVRAVRVQYRLQISPAPAVASFPNDVPTTHPLFRFVEALAAAGITGGCGAGAYCPDAPITRGQMAVFLSTALGLHFPN